MPCPTSGDLRWRSRIFRHMSERPYVRNELGGDVEGHVVQAGSIHGDVNLNVVPSAGAQGDDHAAFLARLRARTESQWATEDAQRRRREATAAQFARSRKRFRRLCWIVLLVAVPSGALWARSEDAIWATVVPSCLAGLGLLNTMGD